MSRGVLSDRSNIENAKLFFLESSIGDFQDNAGENETDRNIPA